MTCKTFIATCLFSLSVLFIPNAHASRDIRTLPEVIDGCRALAQKAQQSLGKDQNKEPVSQIQDESFNSGYFGGICLTIVTEKRIANQKIEAFKRFAIEDSKKADEKARISDATDRFKHLIGVEACIPPDTKNLTVINSIIDFYKQDKGGKDEKITDFFSRAMLNKFPCVGNQNYKYEPNNFTD